MQKSQMRIGQLAKEIGVERFVIRFWEKEFNIKAHRSDGMQRWYTDKELAMFKTIKQLLYEKNYTIQGARKELQRKETRSAESVVTASQSSTTVIQEQLDSVKKDLLKLRQQLELLKQHLR
ncbi:MerR family transcriptional regulator [Candidatus Dependentiae bacterium]|nr:MerR family transcriptional regulator [Candidatus Dependentiae bacterium]